MILLEKEAKVTKYVDGGIRNLFYRWFSTKYVGVFCLLRAFFPRLFGAREIATQ